MQLAIISYLPNCKFASLLFKEQKFIIMHLVIEKYKVNKITYVCTWFIYVHNYSNQWLFSHDGHGPSQVIKTELCYRTCKDVLSKLMYLHMYEVKKCFPN
jgi:hypothetical protein